MYNLHHQQSQKQFPKNNEINIQSEKSESNTER